MDWHTHQRSHLARLLHEAGPDAPTLCAGWRTRHLAVHLVLREHTPWRLIDWPRPWGHRAIAQGAVRAADDVAFHDMVDFFAAPPSPWHPAAWAGERMNLLEFLVHGQDVARAGDAQIDAEQGSAEEDDALWSAFKSMAPILFRKSEMGVILVRPDGIRHAVGPGARKGSVVIRGEVRELILHAFGRGRHADVVVAGPPELTARLMEDFPTNR